MTDDGLRIADREALRELRARYTHTYDGGRLDDFADLFTEDAALQLGPLGFVRGRGTIREALAPAMAAAAFAVHFTTDEVTEFTGEDTARGISRFAVHYGRAPDMEGAGTYHDEYVRTAQGWRFARRAISFFYMGPRDPWPVTPPPVEEG